MDKRKRGILAIAILAVVIVVSVVIIIAVSGKQRNGETTEVSNQNVESKDTQITKEEEVIPDYEIDPAYKLVWEDNFDGEELNRDDWNVELHEPGWVNNELQEYVDSKDNIYLEDGKLIIQALKTVSRGSASYTSGRINTQNKHDYKFGRFEVRAKVPTGQGFLPAFWLMATDENLYGQWPKCGEVDIMEVVGSDVTTAYGNIHYGEPHEDNQGIYQLTDGDFYSDFHVFACEWEPDEIRWYVDGELFHTVNDWFSAREGIGEVTYPAPFDQPFYIILNLAVGGDWPGNPKPGVEFDETCRMVVDYVRVYQKESYDENVTKPEPVLDLKGSDDSGNFVINGDFAEAEDLSDTEDWIFLLAGSGRATADIIDNEIVITPETIGDLEYSVQLVQANMPMVQGMKYKLSFDAYAAENREIITAITAPTNSWVRYFPDTRVALTTEKQNYSFEFEMTDKSDDNGRVEFNMGALDSKAQVCISNVRLEQIGEAEIIEPGKTVLLDGNYIYNGEFHQGADRMEYWVFDNKCEGAAACVTNIDNVRELKVDIPAGVTSLEDVIVRQDEIPLGKNKEYVLTFDAYADGDKQIKTLLAGQTFESTLTTEKQTFKYAFETGDGNQETSIEFLLGTEGTVYIDNVRVQEDGMLINGDFSNGMVGYELYAYTTSDVSYAVDSLSEDNAFSIDISNTGDLDWKIQLKQNNITLEKDKWYSLSFDAKGPHGRKIMFALQRDGSSDDNWIAYSGSPIVELTADYQTYNVQFQMTSETDTQTILSISMGAVGGKQITDKHTICIDNIVLDEIEPQELQSLN